MMCCRECLVHKDKHTQEDSLAKRAITRSSSIPANRKVTSDASASLPKEAAGGLTRRRRFSVGNTSCFSGFQNLNAAGRSVKVDATVNATRASIARSTSRSSFESTVALIRSALGRSGKDKMQAIKAEPYDEAIDDDDSGDDFDKPILSFRGGSAWQALNLNGEVLALDLFWPSKKHSRFENPFRPEIMPLEELSSLCNFRNLRKLKLTGMLQSYQKYIWQTVWLNPGLEELELEMALEPCIRRTFNEGWPSIKGDWSYQTADKATGSYYGESGEGELHRRAGVGEYLDKEAIANAKARASEMGCTVERLPVVKISLTGFVVDADPFFLWFNPHRLRVINFKNDCVDAGFALPRSMTERVVVSWPNNVAEYALPVRLVKPGEVKLIDIPKRKGKAPATATAIGKAKLVEIPPKGGKAAAKATEKRLASERVSQWRKADFGGGNAVIEKTPDCLPDGACELHRHVAFKVPSSANPGSNFMRDWKPASTSKKTK